VPAVERLDWLAQCALPTKLSCVLDLSPTLSHRLGDVRDGLLLSVRAMLSATASSYAQLFMVRAKV
jgi:hypothetical protein